MLPVVIPTAVARAGSAFPCSGALGVSCGEIDVPPLLQSHNGLY